MEEMDNLSNVSTPPISPVMKKKGRQGKKKGGDGSTCEKPTGKRGRPKKVRVKDEPSSPPDTPTRPPRPQSASTEQTTTAKKRRGGKRLFNKKIKTELPGGVVITHGNNIIDVDEIIPDEFIMQEELAGFEKVEVFNAMLGHHRLDPITEGDSLFPMPMSMGSVYHQFNGVNFGMNYQIRLEEPKDEPDISSNIILI